MIIIDTNILISALIKDSATRHIIITAGPQFAYPEVSLQEIKKYENYIIDKSGHSKIMFEKLLNKLLEYVNLIPLEIIEPKLNQAREIMKNIDINDAIFIATALALDNSIIWSEDTDFDKQKVIKIIKTKDLVKIFKKD